MLAAAFLYPEDIITYQESLPASVELHGSQTRGQVVINHKNNTVPNTMLIETIDVEFFKNLLLIAAEETALSFERK